MKTAIELIADERIRQIEQENWTYRHDDQHVNGDIADAAAIYAMCPLTRKTMMEQCSEWPWPWDESSFRPSPHDRIRELVKAGALIVAEIQRLQRAAPNIGLERTPVRSKSCVREGGPS